MDYSDYRDSRQADRKERYDAIERISRDYNVSFTKQPNEFMTWGEIESAAGIDHIEDPWTYLFLARCYQRGLDLKDDYGEDWEEWQHPISEAAEAVVPYQTYVLWTIWVDCGYEDDYPEDMGYQPELGKLDRIPQIQLYAYAERVIYAAAQKYNEIN
jgi:hypothetical protein